MSEPQSIAPQYLGELAVGLPPWTYRNAELVELEYERVILPSWQFVCHANQLQSPGDYATLDMKRDSVMVMRGADGELRAFSNFCRHRGTKLLDGSGSCRNRIVCPYHGWSYGLDGAMVAAPAESTFPGLDKKSLGLKQVEMEILMGLIFVRVISGGPSLKEIWGDYVNLLAPFGIETFVPLGEPAVEIWNSNWKVAIDNNLENYHIAMGHPGYHRMLDNDMNGFGNRHGVAGSKSVLKQRLSPNWSEQRYQKLAPRALSDAPEDVRKTWYFFIMQPNIGIDIYPDSMDIFQILPHGAETCSIRYPLFAGPGESRELKVLRYLNSRINRQVTAEDRVLSERVQMGMGSHGYEPGPLSTYESCLKDFHDRIRAACPVTLLTKSPPAGQVRQVNAQMAARR
ncbi:MAG: aromatic ring-hydroxylating oxygenase subunit alpha [Dongiaceae bacterium]